MEWISVKDRLPEKDGEYLVYCNHDLLDEMFVSISDYSNGDFVDYLGITHWMPLPEPPKD